MKIYLAARYGRREELNRYADQLRKKGYEVCARWLGGTHEMAEGVVAEAHCPEQTRVRFCAEDMEDVQACDMLVAFTEYSNAISGASRGGRHVELGLALAWGKPVAVVGPKENIFCYAAGLLHFSCWANFYDGLKPFTEEKEVNLPIDFIADPLPIGESEEPSSLSELSPFQSPLTIADYIKESHGTALAKGWWEQREGQPERNFPEQIALMHSELSEALEEFRNHGLLPHWFLYGKTKEEGQPVTRETMETDTSIKPEGIAAEFADVLIRIFDTCGRYGIPLAKALQGKCAYNHTRPYRHGGKKA